MDNKGLVVIYNNEVNETKVEVKLIDNNAWMTQDQIVLLYQSSKSNISEHIKHIIDEGELSADSVVRNFRITASDGKIIKERADAKKNMMNLKKDYLL